MLALRDLAGAGGHLAQVELDLLLLLGLLLLGLDAHGEVDAHLGTRLVGRLQAVHDLCRRFVGQIRKDHRRPERENTPGRDVRVRQVVHVILAVEASLDRSSSIRHVLLEVLQALRQEAIFLVVPRALVGLGVRKAGPRPLLEGDVQNLAALGIPNYVILLLAVVTQVADHVAVVLRLAIHPAPAVAGDALVLVLFPDILVSAAVADLTSVRGTDVDQVAQLPLDGVAAFLAHDELHLLAVGVQADVHDLGLLAQDYVLRYGPLLDTFELGNHLEEDASSLVGLVSLLVEHANRVRAVPRLHEAHELLPGLGAEEERRQISDALHLALLLEGNDPLQNAAVGVVVPTAEAVSGDEEHALQRVLEEGREALLLFLHPEGDLVLLGLATADGDGVIALVRVVVAGVLDVERQIAATLTGVAGQDRNVELIREDLSVLSGQHVVVVVLHVHWIYRCHEG